MSEGASTATLDLRTLHRTAESEFSPSPASDPLQGRAAAGHVRRNLFVVYNPIAGRHKTRFRRTLRYLARHGCLITVRETSGRGDAERFARDAIGEGYDAIVVAGGDGTINEVANALAGSGETLAIIPLGTANVLANEIGLDMRPDRVASVIAHGPRRHVHLGRVDGRRFLLMAGFGFDARVVESVKPGLKRLLSKGAYVHEAVCELFRKRDARFEVVVDGVKSTASSVIVANGRYYAGRYSVAPAARLADPQLYVCLQRRGGAFSALKYSIAMVLGLVHRLPDVDVLPAESIGVYGPEEQPVQADGDIVGHGTHRISLDRDTLSLVMPA